MYLRIFVTLIVCVTLTGAGCSGALDKPAETIAQAAKDASERLAIAVPGEMFLELLRKSHDADAKVAAQAQQEVEDIFGIKVKDLEEGLELDVTFETGSVHEDGKEHPHIRAAIRQTTTTQVMSARYLISNRSVTNLTKYGVSSWSNQTNDQMVAKVKQQLSSALDDLVGTPAIGDRQSIIFPSGLLSHEHAYEGGGGINSSRFTGGPVIAPPLCYAGSCAGQPKPLDQVNASKQKIIDEVTAAILAAYSQIELPAVPLSNSITWPIADGSALVVFLDSDSLNAYGDNLKVHYLLHKKGDRNVTYKNRRDDQFISASAFRDNPEDLLGPAMGGKLITQANIDMLGNIEKGKKLYWASADIMGIMITPDVARQLRDALQALNAASSGPK